MKWGAVASLLLTLYFGRHNPHLTITALFAGWVTAPYMTLALVHRLVGPRSPRVAAAAHVLGIVIGGVSVCAYTWFIVHPRTTTPSAPFVLVPLLAFIAIAIVIPTAAFRSRSIPA